MMLYHENHDWHPFFIRFGGRTRAGLSAFRARHRKGAYSTFPGTERVDRFHTAVEKVSIELSEMEDDAASKDILETHRMMLGILSSSARWTR
jgi:hypothetical protein